MPNKLEDYERDFMLNSLSEKYGPRNVTPEIYQKEIKLFLKKMDPLVAARDIVNFINDTALHVVQGSNWREPYAKDPTLYPLQYIGNLMKDNSPSKEVKQIINKNMNRDSFVQFCQEVEELPRGDRSENLLIEEKMNKFKIIEACKPRGNAFTNFFKKLFNIGGYNDKLAAYESCKTSLQSSIGDKLTNEEFEHHISSEEHFSTYHLRKEPSKEHIIVPDEKVDNIKAEKVVGKDKTLEKELVNDELNI